MRRDTRLLLFDLSAFHALCLSLMTLAYACDNKARFVFFMTFWIKSTGAMAGAGILYALYHFAVAEHGLAPQSPPRLLGRMFLAIGICSFLLQLMQPPPDFVTRPRGVEYYVGSPAVTAR